MTRVAVIGGGLSGSLAALVLRSRGLRPIVLDAGRRRIGGRLSGGVHSDSGVQFLRASEPGSQWHTVLQQLASAKILAPWNGRFGLLGPRGGFLPREVLGTHSGSLSAMLKTDGGKDSGSVDFCGFIADADQTLYVGVPSNASIADSVCAAAGIDVVKDASVNGMQWQPGANQWRLDVGGSGATAVAEQAFDALVVATHNAALAATAVRATAATGLAHSTDDVRGRLDALALHLEAQLAQRTVAAFTWSGYFPPGTSERLPFDAATAPPSRILLFLARDASKPGRPALCHPPSRGTMEPADQREAELWTAVSTPQFAQMLIASAPAGDSSDSDRGGAAATAAAQLMTEEVTRIFASYFGGEPARVPLPAVAAARRWAVGFPDGTLCLSEDAVGLEPWRLAIAGDFLRDLPSPVEAAASSGLAAGEKVASWFDDG